MATSFFPFDAGAGSAITEAQWQKMARRWLGTGVLDDYLNELAVTADGSGMTVSVASGGCWIEGHYFESDAAAAQTIAAADATNGRIDYVVVELDRTANTCAFKVVAGTAASSPVAPTLTQTDALWQMPLATVTVDAAVGVIASGKVTDDRSYAANVPTSVVNTKGQLVVGTAPSTLGGFRAGTDGQTLVAYDTTASGLEWKDAPTTATVAASESTTSTAYADLATAGPSASVTVPPSGRVLVIVSARQQLSVSERAYMSFADGAVASDDRAFQTFGTGQVAGSKATVVTGLSVGATYTATAKYRVISGTGTFAARDIVVIPL